MSPWHFLTPLYRPSPTFLSLTQHPQWFEKQGYLQPTLFSIYLERAFNASSSCTRARMRRRVSVDSEPRMALPPQWEDRAFSSTPRFGSLTPRVDSCACARVEWLSEYSCMWRVCCALYASFLAETVSEGCFRLLPTPSSPFISHMQGSTDVISVDNIMYT